MDRKRAEAPYKNKKKKKVGQYALIRIHNNVPPGSDMTVTCLLANRDAETNQPPHSPDLSRPDSFIFPKARRFHDTENIDKHVNVELNEVPLKPSVNFVQILKICNKWSRRRLLSKKSTIFLRNLIIVRIHPVPEHDWLTIYFACASRPMRTTRTANLILLDLMITLPTLKIITFFNISAVRTWAALPTFRRNTLALSSKPKCECVSGLVM
jgi:hypothetical protein